VGEWVSGWVCECVVHIGKREPRYQRVSDENDENCRDGSGAALEAQAGNASSSPTRDSPPQKELPAPPTSPKQLPPDSKGGPPSKAAAAAPSVDTLARVVASVTLNLRMHEGAPIASAQVSLKVA